MENIINYIIENDIKTAELKILEFLYNNRRSKKTHIEEGCKINFYQVKLFLPKLVRLGFIKEEDNLYTINKKNKIIIKLFEEIKNGTKLKMGIVSSEDVFNKTKNPNLSLSARDILNNKKIITKEIKNGNSN